MSLIELRNIKKNYPQEELDLKILKGISLKINSGEFVAIMGASGSGKSTLMNILGFLDIPSSGNYLFEGKDTGCLSKNQLATIRNEKIGFVFQGFNLINKMNAYENVELPMIYAGIPQNQRDKKVKNIITTVGLKNRMFHYPYQLSGGQQQRIAIARAMINNAPIILADEPTGNLDSKTSLEIMDLFLKLNKEYGRTVILVTHALEIADYANRQLKISDGKIIEDIKKEVY